VSYNLLYGFKAPRKRGARGPAAGPPLMSPPRSSPTAEPRADSKHLG